MSNSSAHRRCTFHISLWFAAFGIFWTASSSAATLNVTSLADSGPGTLRDRIAIAAPGDLIQFAVSGTIILNSELAISKNLTINGGGSELLKISGNNATRIFNITAGTAQIYNMTIANGRVVGANGPVGVNGENVYGAGVLVASGASLGMQSCVVSNNVALGGQGGGTNQMGFAGNGGNGYGGALAARGSLNMTWCTIVSNTASGGLGTATTAVGGQGWGGGLYLEGSANVWQTTLHANRAVAGSAPGGPGGALGGGIFNFATLTLLDTTICSNSASGSSTDAGGGIDNNSGFLSIRDSTIVGNEADFGGGLSGGGSIENTILAGNSAPNGPDASGSLTSNDYNFIQNTSGISFIGTTTHNITGQNPLLGPLQFNGGPDLSYFTLLTIAPLPGSPVIDKGRSTVSSDQRLYSRPYDTSLPNAVGGNGADIGAIEVHPTTFVVKNTNASGVGSLAQAIADNNGLGGSNTIIFSNTVSGTITLAGSELVVLAPIVIRGPGPNLLSISANRNGRIFDIREPAEISGLTIRDGLLVGAPGSQGQNGQDVRGGAVFTQSALTLSNCVVRSNTVVGGVGSDLSSGFAGQGGKAEGGAIYNAAGILSLKNCLFDGNSAIGGKGGNGFSGEAGSGGNGFGGAFFGGGTTTVSVCSFIKSSAIGGAAGNSTGGTSGNGGQGWGGAFYNEGSLSLFASTIAGSRAMGGTGAGGNGSGYGGGIYNVNDAALLSCTIASNSATGSSFNFGGGISSVGTLATTNCTIAGNQSDYGGGVDGNVTAVGTIFGANTASFGADVNGAINSFDYNLLQSFPGANVSGATTHFIIGLDPMLGPLQNNGGSTLTMAPRANSPVIDKSRNLALSNTDQRGFPRPWDLPSVPNAGGGDGSDIGACEFLPNPTLNIQRVNATNVVLSWSTDASDFALEFATSLSTPHTWSEVDSTRAFIGNQVYVTNSFVGPARFYRLSLATSSVVP